MAVPKSKRTFNNKLKTRKLKLKSNSSNKYVLYDGCLYNSVINLKKLCTVDCKSKCLK